MSRYLACTLANIPYRSAIRRIHRAYYPSQEDVNEEPEQQGTGRRHISGCVIEGHFGECYRILDWLYEYTKQSALRRSEVASIELGRGDATAPERAWRSPSTTAPYSFDL
jgi:hypothetical protein